MTQANDYSAFVDEAQDNDALAKLALLAQELYDAEQNVAKAETALKRAQAVRDKLAQVTIPEAMDDAGLKSVDTTAGITLEVTSKIRGGFKKDQKEAAMDWMVENKEGGLVVNEVTVSLPKGANDEAAALEEKLEDYEDVKRKRSVHTQTLEKWIRERKAAGKKVPEELFNVFEQRGTKIKKSKDD